MALSTDFAPVQQELQDRDACAFVHVGTEVDPTLRYLGRTGGVPGELAVVVTEEQSLLLAPDAPDAATETFPGDQVLPAGSNIPTGKRVATVLDDLGLSGTVLSPQHVPHDAALYLEQAGFDVASSGVVAEARQVKTDPERLRQTTVQSAACAGMRRIAAVLDEAHEHEDGAPLHWEDAPLTALRLRREANAAMAKQGVHPGSTAIGIGTNPTTPRSSGAVWAGETVVVDLAPHGPDGYHGRLARTFVVDGDGGWTRRAQLAVEGALDAALAELGPGETADLVATELEAEVAAYGFDSKRVAGYGVGLAPREPPALTDVDSLEAGTVLALDASVSDPEEGTVRLADLVEVTDEGAKLLGAFPRSLVP
ncbi:M24 family metallopeptidase [Haloarchaeobius sp. DFWS5]|uniref:M24 family metallopeptidase n=1 Tax=Haloarchaeobius sp. DFWS5 TaxID=3446114 RepID=UPI003EBF1CDC